MENEPTKTISASSQNTLPSVKTLFVESWNVLWKSIRPLFLISLIACVVIGAVLAVSIFAFSFFLTGTVIFASLSNGENLAAMLPLMLGITMASLVFGVIMSLTVYIFQAAEILALDQQGQVSIMSVLKKGFNTLVPLFIIGIVIGFFVLGGFFVFIIPAILFGILFVFVPYEVVLHNQTGINAVRRSAAIVLSNFWGIFFRFILLWIASYVLAYCLQYALHYSWYISGNNTILVFSGVGIQVVFNVVLSWYGIAYGLTLYKQACVLTPSDKQVTMWWMWLIAMLGWLLFFATIVIAIQLVSLPIFRTFLASNFPMSKEKQVSDALDKQEREIKAMSPQARKHYDTSAQLFKQLSEVNTTDRKKGVQLAEQNVEELKKALKIEPNNAVLWYSLGNAYTWIAYDDNPKQELGAFKKAESLEPHDITYINAVGDSLIRQERYEDAILEFQKTLRLTKESGYAYMSIGIAYKKLKIYDAAKENLEKALTVFKSENKYGSYDKAILEVQKELATMSVSGAQRFIDEGNKKRDLVIEITDKGKLTQNDLDQVEAYANEAIDNYKEAAKLEPNNYLPQFYLGEMYSILYRNGVKGFDVQARDAYVKALGLTNMNDTDRYLIHNQLGNIYFARKDYESALGSYQKAVELKKDFGNGYANMGDTYSLLGNTGEAKKSYQKALLYLDKDTPRYKQLENWAK